MITEMEKKKCLCCGKTIKGMTSQKYCYKCGKFVADLRAKNSRYKIQVETLKLRLYGNINGCRRIRK